MEANKVKVAKTGAVAMLAIAIGLLILALASSWRASATQGPSALIALASSQVWIGVDDEIWRVTNEGRLIDRRPVSAVGLPGAPSQLVRHPGGAVVATVRDDPTLYFLDPQSAQVVRRLTPRWPGDLGKHGARAITLAFGSDGRIAIATGGGHAVALFDTEGGFIARTAAGLYQFSNGLWWQGQDLWTTDTNRFQLKRLDGATLALRETRALQPEAGGGFLGPARATSQAEPVTVALVRYRTQMIVGHIVALDDQGRETAFAAPGADAEPRDVDWLGNELIASDGGTLAVWRWATSSSPPSLFGDDELRAHWSALSTRRDALQGRYRTALGWAIGVFVIALALAIGAERLTVSPMRAAGALDLSKLGTPVLSQRELLTLHVRAWGWLLALPLSMFVLTSDAVVSTLRQLGGRPLHVAVAMAFPILMLAISAWQWPRLKRLAADPAFEPLFNGTAMRQLRGNAALKRMLHPDERVLETFSWMLPTLHWAVLTEQRLLLFTATLFDARLKHTIVRADVESVGTVAGLLKRRSFGQRLLLDRVQGGANKGWLEIRTRDGQTLAGAAGAPTVARRVAVQLQRDVDSAVNFGVVPRIASVTPPAARQSPGAVTAAIASALVPGLGQWMQRRRASALLMFVPWATAVAFLFLPVMWALWGPRTAVSGTKIVMALTLAATYAAAAAWDAWRMAPARKR